MWYNKSIIISQCQTTVQSIHKNTSIFYIFRYSSQLRIDTRRRRGQSCQANSRRHMSSQATVVYVGIVPIWRRKVQKSKMAFIMCHHKATILAEQDGRQEITLSPCERNQSWQRVGLICSTRTDTQSRPIKI